MHYVWTSIGFSALFGGFQHLACSPHMTDANNPWILHSEGFPAPRLHAEPLGPAWSLTVECSVNQTPLGNHSKGQADITVVSAPGETRIYSLNNFRHLYVLKRIPET